MVSPSTGVIADYFNRVVDVDIGSQLSRTAELYYNLENPNPNHTCQDVVDMIQQSHPSIRGSFQQVDGVDRM